MQKNDIKKHIFVPGKYVPLSCFTASNLAGEKLEFYVKSDILGYILDNNCGISIACEDGCNIEYLEHAGIDKKSGTVFFTTGKKGTFTVVSKAFVNDFPVVTHWNQELNNGRGGFCEGACDAPGYLDIDPESEEIKSERPIYDSDPKSPYTFLTGEYAFFAGEENGENMKVPDYECYIGENYSLSRVSDRLAVWISNKVLEETGYPVVYANCPNYNTKEGYPAFQVINNYIIPIGGKKPSLATFILPPYWTTEPPKPYPVIFSGFYDNNENFYQSIGLPFLSIIGRLIKEGTGAAIGIVWNGGGSIGTRTYQHSAFRNLSELFAVAADCFVADIYSIVAVGGSRGGMTALIASGNPYYDNYRIKYAVCYNPIIRFGENGAGAANPTCPLVYAALSEDTGYKYSWMKNWKEPQIHLNGEELLLCNLFGVLDRDIANNVLSPASGNFVKSLKEKGVKIFLCVGTHDAFATKNSIIDFSEDLLRNGVQVHLQIGYRFGHNNCTDLYGHAEDFLRKILLEEEVELKGVSHYKRLNNKPEEWEKAEKFMPAHQPVFFEGLKRVAHGDRAVINIVGGEGMGYNLKLFKIDDSAWLENEHIIKIDEGRTLFKGVFPKKTVYLDGKISYITGVIEFNETFVPGFYLYELWYSLGENWGWMQIPQENVPQPGAEGQPLLQVIKEYPMVSGIELAQSQNVKAIGWGLCEV